MSGRAGASKPFVFLHVGDLHLTKVFPEGPAVGNAPVVDSILTRRAERMEKDLAAIFGDIAEADPKGIARFVYLPGDLAENGCESEYEAIATAIADVARPIRLIPGDHDRALGSMAAFAAFRAKLVQAGRVPLSEGPAAAGPIDGPVEPDPLRPRPRSVDQFYFHEDHGSIRCIFLDVVSAGQGRKGWGLDFRLGSRQKAWLIERLRHRPHTIRTVLVFMHCYPADLHEAGEAAEVAGLIWNESVRLVEMGHTHYNELAHDGRTTYATARSVGQNEDGPAGYAVVAVDGGEVSWRFRQIQQTWPFVLITSPADRQLATRPLEPDSDGTVTVRALVLAPNRDLRCRCRVDGGGWIDMKPDTPWPGFFQKRVKWPPGSRLIEVEAEAATYPGWGEDLIDRDAIEPPTHDPARFPIAAYPQRPGSDATALPSWPVKGTRGDQLGPNRRGRKW